LPQNRLLYRLTLTAHVGLALAVGLTLGRLALGPGFRSILILIALLPLVLTLRGLMAGRGESLRWLALALVLYAGLGAVEVIATGTWAAIFLLLCALIELALVLILVRAPSLQSPPAAGES
jgi:hypothetical protein